ncbi:MAG: M18 family aminopeptidase [Ectothiorhodospiraceae bacterium]
MDPETDATADLQALIDASPSPWHAVATMVERLEKAGFRPLDERETWDLQPDTGYYIVRGGGTLVALITGSRPAPETGFRILGAHTDSPGFRVKPSGVVSTQGYPQIPVELYGSPIIASFADRELALAGQVFVRDPDDNTVTPMLYRSPGAVARLPNAAIHLNHDVNREGLRFERHDELALQTDLAVTDSSATDALTVAIAADLRVEPRDLVSWELAVSDSQPAARFGWSQEYLAAPRLDNLASCHAGLTALLASDSGGFDGPRVLACFDHEEVGSTSYRGAESSPLNSVLERLSGGPSGAVDAYRRALARSVLVSVDMAHGYHPGFPRLYDNDNRIRLNGGPAIKINAQQRYATDAGAEAVFAGLCDEIDVPCQRYVHRNDIPCGTTIGPITGSALGVRTVDVGNPLWSMHSARETMGAHDQARMIRVLSHYLTRRELPLRDGD